MSLSDTDYPVWYYVEAGVTQGPVPVQAIQAMVGSGRLGPNDYVRHIGWTSWWRVFEAVNALGLVAAAQPAPVPTAMIGQTYAAGVAAYPPGMQPMAYAMPAGVNSGPSASRFARTMAWFVDLALLVLVLVGSNRVFGYPPVATLVTVTVTLAYLVALPAAGLVRLGHLLLNLRIVNADTLESPNKQALAARGLVLLLLAAPLLAGAIGSVFNVYVSARRVAWHDAVTGTMVVKKT